MNDDDYPALYRVANEASARAQDAHFRCLRWYKARAIAESVKTATWRYMMRAEPFDGAPDSPKDASRFALVLRTSLDENRKQGALFSGEHVSADQITQTMMSHRNHRMNERLKFYTEQRIVDQCRWYSDKAAANGKGGTTWFLIFIALQAGALIASIFRIGVPEFEYFPTLVLVTAASAALGWLSTKRFRELAASYGVVVNEIGLIKVLASHVTTEKAFSVFVGDAENAFSREHTQWAVRRDALD